MQPLPGGKLPADQTLEGGAQIRVTKQGFDKLTSIVPGFINDQVGDGICVPEGTQYSVHYCYENQNQCTKGCDVDVGLNQLQFLAKNNDTVTLRIDVSVQATVPTDAPFFDPCYIYANGAHVYGDANVELKADPATGQLTVQLVSIDNFNLSQLNLTGSGGFCSGASAFASFLKDYFAEQIGDYLAPRLDNFIQDYLPDPLGVDGVVDLGPLLAGISPGSDGALEARVVPGGFATVSANAPGTTARGLTLGRWDGDSYVVRGFDVAFGEAIRIAFGTPGDREPSTAWQSGARASLSRADAAALAEAGELAVFLEDERGNRTIATVAPFLGQAGASGCACDAGATSPGAGLLLVLLTVVGLRRGRRR